MIRAATVPDVSDQLLVWVIIGCFLCLPFSFILMIMLTMAQGGGTTFFLRLMTALWSLWSVSLVLGPISGVVFQKLKWRWATWISIVAPVSLTLAMGVMLLLAFTTDVAST